MDNIQDKKADEIIKERFQTLPKIIQDAITNSGWEEKIRLISKKYNFRIDQGGALEENIFLFMLALISYEELKSNLKQEINIPDEELNKLILEVDEQILFPIKEHVVSFIAEEDEAEDMENLKSNKDSLLKEIEDADEEETELIIPSKPQTPSTQVNTAEQNQKIIEQDLKTSSQASASVAQKLQTPSVSEPKKMTIDPYRELPE